jgi:hypothetical protein
VTKSDPIPIAQSIPVRSGVGTIAEERDYWPTEDWHTLSPEEQSMDSAEPEEMMALVGEHNVAVDSVLVVCHGTLVFEEYRHGYDQNTLHHVQSVTKSFSSVLIGIAIHKGLIDSVEQKMVDLFPDHTSKTGTLARSAPRWRTF